MLMNDDKMDKRTKIRIGNDKANMKIIQRRREQKPKQAICTDDKKNRKRKKR